MFAFILYEPKPDDRDESGPLGMTRAEGYIKNVNTIEEFKNTDKNAMIKKAGEQVRIQ